MLNMTYCKPEQFDDALTKVYRELPPKELTYEAFALAIWRAAIESAIGTLRTTPSHIDPHQRLVQLRDARRP